MDYYHFLEFKPECVFAADGYGGIQKIKLDWENNVSFSYGELNDDYESLQDLFEELECVLDIKELV
jgi:hypothetical protein